MRYQPQFLALALALLASAKGQMTQATIDKRLKIEVLSSFNVSLTQYDLLLNQLWNLLRDYDPEAVAPLELPKSLKNRSDGFVSSLHLAANNCKSLQNDAHDLVAQQTENVSAIESSVESKLLAVSTSKIRVRTSQDAVNLGEIDFRKANGDMARLRAELRDAEYEHTRAKTRCKQDITPQGFWHGVGIFLSLPFRVVVRIICKVPDFFFNNVRNTERRLESVERRVANHKAHLQDKREQLENAKATLASEQQQLASLQKRRSATKFSLEAARQKLRSLAATKTKLMKTVGFLDGVKARGGAVSVAMEMAFLLDVDNVVEPLREINHYLVRLEPGSRSDIELSVSTEDIVRIREKLDKLREKSVL